MEEWRDIKGFEGFYQVSNMGNVKSLARIKQCNKKNPKEQILRFTYRRHGYKAVWLYKGDKGKAYSVHRLVAEAFIENPEGKKEVNHINEDKADNRAVNLEWVTHKENMNSGTLHERISANQKRRTDHKRRVVCVDDDGTEIMCFESGRAATEHFGLSHSAICTAIKRGYKTAGYRWAYCFNQE